MLSKGSVAILPVILLGIILWQHKLTRYDILRIAPFFAVAVALAAVNVWFQTHGSSEVIRSAGFIERLLGAGGVVWFYLYKALLPINLIFIYPQWHIQTDFWLWWLPLLAALTVTALLWKYRQGWSRPILFAWGFFCVSLLPVMGFTDVGFMEHSLVADHYQHIALLGVIALAAAGFGFWHQRAQVARASCPRFSLREIERWAATLLAVAVVTSFIFLTWRQSEIYHNDITLYRTTLENNPQCWIAQYNLGYALDNLNRTPEAIECYEKALLLKYNYPEAHANLAKALVQMGRPLEAVKHGEEALRLRPDYILAYNNLGAALIKLGRSQDAIEYYERALKIKPDYPELHVNLGAALFKTGRFPEAIEHYEQALAMNSKSADTHNNLGNALFNTGRTEEAVEQYKQAIQLEPHYVMAYNNLGIALVKMGRAEEAIEYYKQALGLKPDNIEVHNNLGNAFKSLGQYKQAIEHYEKALLINPDIPDVHNNLGNVLIQAGRPVEAIDHLKQALKLNPDYVYAYANLASAYSKTHQSAQAVAAAQKALELARSQGQTALAQQLEDWLNSYRAQPAK